MPDISPNTWIPPEAKTTAKWGKYLMWAGIAIAGVYFWNGFAPDLVTAESLLATILQNGTKAIEAAGVFMVALFLFYEVFSKNGKLNKLLNLYYIQAVNTLVRQAVAIDPMSPIDERINSLRKDQATFEQNFESVDGLISSIHQKQQDCADKARSAAQHGAAAQKLGKAAYQQSCADEFAQYSKAGEDYAKMAAHMDPLRTVLKQVSESCGVTIQKLTTERNILRDKWDIQGKLAAATNAAGKILGKSRDDTWDMADQAQDVINSKYGEEIGHLEHMKEYAEPLMESIDVDRATYNDAMLQAVTGAGTKMIQSTAATQAPDGNYSTNSSNANQSSVSSFLS